MRVGELVAYIRADSTQYDKTLDTAGAKWGKFATSLEKGANTVTNIVAGTLTAGAAMTASLVKTGGAYNSLQQNSLVALKTMLGGTEQAQKQMERFNEFASKSPFARDVFLQMQQTLLGFGFEAEQVIPTLEAIQDTVAGIGGGEAHIRTITESMAQISSQGKITGQELMRLGNVGVDAAQLIADATGKTREQVKADITAGRMDAETTINALTEGMTAKFGGTASSIKEQWTGAADRIKAAWRDIGGDLMQPFIDPNGGGYAVVWANDVADVMRALQSKIEPIMSAVMERWGDDLDGFGVSIQKVATKIKMWDVDDIGADMDRLVASVKEFAPFLGLVAGGLAGVTSQTKILGPVLGALGLSISPLTGAMLGLLVSTEDNRAALDELGQALMPLISIGSEVTVTFARFASEALAKLMPSLINLAEAFTEAAVPIAGLMVPAIGALSSVLTPLAGVVADVADFMAELPGPVLLAVSAFASLELGIGPMPAMVNAVGTAIGNLASGFSTIHAHVYPVSKSLTDLGVNATVPAQNFISLGNNAAGASTSLSGFGAAASRAGTSLKAAFKTNAPLIAISALVGVLGHFAQKSQEAEQRQQELKGTLDQTTGAVTDQTAAFLVNDEQTRAMAAAYAEAGGNADDYYRAILGEKDALERVNAVMGETAEKTYEISDEMGTTVEYTARASNANADWAKHLNSTKDSLDAAAASTREAAALTSRLTGETEGAAEAAYHAADANRDHLLSMQELTDYQRGLADATVAAKRATLDYADAVTQTAEVADGLADVSADEERALYSLRDQIMRNVDAQNLNGDSTEQLQGLMRSSRDDFINLAVAMGYSADGAAALADDLGLIPENVHSKVEVDTDKAVADVARFVNDIDLETGTVTIDGNAYPLESTLEQAQVGIDNADGTVTIFGNTYPADTSLDEVLNDIAGSGEAVTIDGKDYDARTVLAAYRKSVREGKESVTIGGKDYPAREVVKSLTGFINTQSGTIKIQAANHTTGVVESIISQINQKHATIRVGATSSATKMSLPGNNGLIRKGGHTFMADGDARSRQAMMAPAGSWITWAEDETGGESYIPHAPSKRARSMEILRQTANIFDYMVVPKRVASYADGGHHGANPIMGASVPASRALPSTLVLRVGEREFTAFIEEQIGAVPGVWAASDLVANYGRYSRMRG